jgi:hypothetical protein
MTMWDVTIDADGREMEARIELTEVFAPPPGLDSREPAAQKLLG